MTILGVVGVSNSTPPDFRVIKTTRVAKKAPALCPEFSVEELMQ